MVLREFYKQCEEFIEECKKYIWWLIILAVVLFGFFIIILQIAFTFFVSWVAVSAWAVLGLMNIAIGCIIFEKIFWPWYYMIHEPLPEPRLLRDFIIDTPGVCPICADEDGDCILGSKFDAKTIRSQVSALNVSFKGETTSLRRQRSRRDLSRKPSRRDSSRKSSRRDVSRKSSRKDVSRKNSGRDVSRKSSGRDVSRKSSRKDVSGRKDSSKMDPISRRKRNAERRARRKTTEI